MIHTGDVPDRQLIDAFWLHFSSRKRRVAVVGRFVPPRSDSRGAAGERSAKAEARIGCRTQACAQPVQPTLDQRKY